MPFKMSFSEILKNLLILIFIAQFAPTVIKQFKNYYGDIIEPKTKVALLTLEGTITSSEKLVKNLKKYFEDKEIKAILLKIDSPGGSAGSSQDIFSVIKSLKTENAKPIVSFIENMAASGGYYVAAATDYIIATPSAFVGSIGSYIALPVIKNFIEQFKLKYEIIKSGDYKTTGNPFADMTPQQRAMLQSLSDNVYQQFVNDIAEQRKLPSNPKEWADGKVFTGEQALAKGLIDQVGSHASVVKALEEKAGIKGKIDWVKPKKQTSFLNTLLNDDEDSQNSEFKFFSKIYNGFRNFCLKDAHAKF